MEIIDNDAELKTLESFGDKKNEILSVKKRNKWILYILLLTILSFILNRFFGSGHGTHLDGQIASQEQTANATVKTLFVTIPILGFILGSIFNFIPYKGATYRQKYLRTSLLTILILDCIVFAFSILGSAYQIMN